jgi:hypothetical protein
MIRSRYTVDRLFSPDTIIVVFIAGIYSIAIDACQLSALLPCIAVTIIA